MAIKVWVASNRCLVLWQTTIPLGFDIEDNFIVLSLKLMASRMTKDPFVQTAASTSTLSSSNTMHARRCSSRENNSAMWFRNPISWRHMSNALKVSCVIFFFCTSVMGNCFRFGLGKCNVTRSILLWTSESDNGCWTAEKIDNNVGRLYFYVVRLE